MPDQDTSSAITINKNEIQLRSFRGHNCYILSRSIFRHKVNSLQPPNLFLNRARRFCAEAPSARIVWQSSIRLLIPTILWFGRHSSQPMTSESGSNARVCRLRTLVQHRDTVPRFPRSRRRRLHELFISHRRRSSDGLFLQSNPSVKRAAHHHATRRTSCSRRHKGFALNQTAAQTRLAARTSENCERTRSRTLTSRESFARSALSQAQRLWTRGLADALGILRE